MRDIHEVLDRRAVTTLFQPLVEISTGRVLGYEALCRGPAGSPWERPDALFAAAHEVGRASELDWICRARAYEGALAADGSMLTNRVRPGSKPAVSAPW